MLLANAMKCPRCQAHVENALDSCGKCGFCLDEIDSILGHDQVRLGRLTDRAHCLRLVDSRVMEQRLEIFSRRFPQVFVGVFFGSLPTGVGMRELTFWLLNHARLVGEERVWDNDFAVVMVIDPVKKAVGINTGYALEHIFHEHFLEGVLKGIRTPLWHAEYVDAVTIVLKRLERRLRKFARKMIVGQEFAPPEVEEHFVDNANVVRERDLSEESATDPRRKSFLEMEKED